jgi:tRNA (guanine26-N2/guanine27-N2)-dimethyltransferase
LLNAGYNVSRSHALAGSLKTNAPIEFVHDIMREYIKTNPVKMSNIPDGNPAKVLLAKPQTWVMRYVNSTRTDGRHTIDLTPHPDASKLEKGEKVVYYQANPLPNWGPAARARTVKAGPGPGGPSQPQPSQAQTVLSVEAKSETAGEPDAQKRKADVADEVPAVKKAKVEDEGDADEEEAMNMA